MVQGSGRFRQADARAHARPPGTTSHVRDTLRAHYDDEEMRQRTVRPLGEDRTRALHSFFGQLRVRGARSVIEVGCGAGRDGTAIQAAGMSYLGTDLSPAAVQRCRGFGLPAVLSDATSLPVVPDSFDAAWSMSTLMHLPGEDFAAALDELTRVVRPGGLIGIGVWGHTRDRVWTAPDGRYFRHRTDEVLKAALTRIGTVLDFRTWAWMDDGGHYQWVLTLAH